MSRVLAYLIILLFSYTAFSQEPAWLDPSARANSFPTEKFLTAFGTEVLTKNQSETDAQAKLYEIIKSQISDAILVSINAQTSLNITVENASTDERLERQSASSSEVELVGLKLDSYFEKRKKSLYAFGYVSIEELSNYHRNNILNKSDLVQQNLDKAAGSSSKIEKIQLYVSNEGLLKDIQKSARLLTALSESHGADISTLQSTATKNDMLLDELFHTGTATLEHIAERTVGELLSDITKGSSVEVSRQAFTYSNSTVSSEFSQALNQKIQSSLTTSSMVKFSSSSKGELRGSFIQNDSEIIYNTQLLGESGEVISNTEFAVKTDIINTKGQKLLPPNFEFIPDLSKISIDGPRSFDIKPSAFTTKPLELKYSLEGQPVPNLSLQVSLENEGKTKSYEASSDKNGLVTFYVDGSMVVPGTDYVATIAIDLPSFLSIEQGNPFIEYIYDNQSIPKHETSLSVLSPLVFITSSEEGINGPLSVKVLEPAVKAGLSDLRFAFTDDISQADYELMIEAKARKGQAGEIATLTFIDATISLVNKLNGKEIYKNSFFNIKGVGANFDVAQSSAYKKTQSEMVDDITYELEYNR